MNQPAGNALLEAFAQLTTRRQGPGFYLLDGSGAVRAWSAGCERLFGYREAEMLGERPDRLYAPEDRSPHLSPGEPVGNREPEAEAEVWHVRRDGSRFWANVLTTPLLDAHGGVQGWLREVRDHSDRLPRAELPSPCGGRHPELLSHVSDGIALLDAAFRVEYANPRLAELLHCPVEQIVGRPFAVLFDEETARQLRERLRQDGHARCTEVDVRLVGSDGGATRSRLVLIRSTDAAGAPAETVALFRPEAGAPGSSAQTEASAVTAADRRHRAQYEVTRVLVENAPVQETRESLLRVICESLGWSFGEIWVSDGEDQALRCSALWHRREPRFEPFARATRELRLQLGEGVIGRVWTEAQARWGDTGDPEFRRSQAAQAAGLRSMLVFPVTFVGHVQGVIGFYSEAPFTPDARLLETLDGIGRQLGEFTLRKLSEEALARSEEQLRQAQKMEAIGTLAGGVAHDFNNMLAVISGYSELILLTEGLDEATRSAVEQIRSAADRAAGLTRQLLAFSRKQLLQPRRLDLVALTYDLSRLLQRLIGEDIELVTLGGPQPSMVLADPSQLEQVLMNLVVNARDAMPQGGRITLEVRNVTLDARDMQRHLEAAPGEYVMLAVSDTGCGMDRATAARVFEPFFTTKEPGKGTGLGLATVYGIVKQTGGEIWVYSEPGAGTTFKVFLPRADTEAATATPQDQSPVLGSGTVLLVEDEDLLRALVREVLSASGYMVLEAEDGIAALRIAAEYPHGISLVLTDVVMPQMSGQELAERLRELHPGAKVLFMSGYTDDAVVRHGVQAAEVAFIQKPFSPHQLTRKVQEVLRGTPG